MSLDSAGLMYYFKARKTKISIFYVYNANFLNFAFFNRIGIAVVLACRCRNT